MQITEKTFKKIFFIFLILLLFDYPVLPITIESLSNKQSCEYSMLGCFALSIFLVLIINSFWFLIWHSHHLMFYTDRYKVKGIGEKDSKLVFFIKCLFIQKYFFNSMVGKIFIGGGTVTFCVVVIYIFFKLSHEVINLLS